MFAYQSAIGYPGSRLPWSFPLMPGDGRVGPKLTRGPVPRSEARTTGGPRRPTTIKVFWTKVSHNRYLDCSLPIFRLEFIMDLSPSVSGCPMPLSDFTAPNHPKVWVVIHIFGLRGQGHVIHFKIIFWPRHIFGTDGARHFESTVASSSVGQCMKDHHYPDFGCVRGHVTSERCPVQTL